MKVLMMIFVIFCAFLLFHGVEVEGGRVYKKRNISEQAWNGVDTGIKIDDTKLDTIAMDSIMTAKLRCSIECDNHKSCGLFRFLEGEGIICILAQLHYWTFEEEFTGPEVEVYINKDIMVEAGKMYQSHDSSILTKFSSW